jgi:enediyne biosynthesis protein E4
VTSAAPRRLPRRHRRTLGTAVVAGAVLATLGVLAFSRRQAAQYDPSARPEGITAALERAVPPDYPRVTFVDAARDAHLAFRHFPGERSTQLPEDMGSGASGPLTFTRNRSSSPSAS